MSNRRIALVGLVLLYALVWGQNWTHYAAALMLAAIIRDARHTGGRSL